MQAHFEMNRRSLLTSVARYHAICKVFGLTPFTVDTELCEIRRSLASAVYALAVLFMSLAAAFILLEALQAMGVRGQYSIRYVWQFCNVATDMATEVTAVASDLLQNTCKYQRMVALLSYRDSDALLPRRSSSAVAKIACQVAYVGSLVLHVAIWTLGYLDYGFRWTYSSMLFSRITVLTAVCRYMALVLLVRSDLRHLNQSLTATAQARCEGRPLTCRYRALRRVYLALCQLSQEVLPAHQLLLMFLLLTTLSSAAWNVVAIETEQHGRQAVTHILFLSLQLLQVLVVAAASHALSREAAQTAPALCRLLLGSTLGCTEAAELRRFLRSARSHCPANQLFDIAPLDMRLLLVSLSFITTCTIILLTFWTLY